jgi:hypothetical protein
MAKKINLKQRRKNNCSKSVRPYGSEVEMSISKGTPCSSQLIWFEQRIVELDAAIDAAKGKNEN